MKIIKVSGLHDTIIHQTLDNRGVWDNCKFVLNDPHLDECDAWFVFDPNCLKEGDKCLCPKDKVFYIMGEPDCIHIYNDGFIKQFPNVIGIQKKHYDVQNMFRNYWCMWFVGLSFADGVQRINPEFDFDKLLQMPVPQKDKLISVVSSDKRMCEGHVQRLEFVDKLKEHFGDKIDVFGRGINSFDDKADVLMSYKYHIAIENAVQDDYITEKLLDPFITYTYPIYHGADNVGNYFNNNSFTQIDIRKPEKSIKIIEDIINGDLFDKRLEYIKESREKVLKQYNLFNKMAMMVNQSNNSNSKKHLIKLKPENAYGYKRKIKRIIKKIIKW